MYYILAFLFVAVLAFEYFQTRQYIGVIQYQTRVISDLKTFIVGKPSNDPCFLSPPVDPPSHPDFGLGNIMKEIDEAESGKEI